jgi:hypothetical protein
MDQKRSLVELELLDSFISLWSRPEIERFLVSFLKMEWKALPLDKTSKKWDGMFNQQEL